MHQDVIYAVPMSPCKHVYIRETGHTLGKRLYEHKAALRNQTIKKSGIVDHCPSCPSSCKPHFENTQIKGRETNTYKRKISESLEMGRVDLLAVGSKSTEVGNICNKTFLNRL